MTAKFESSKRTQQTTGLQTLVCRGETKDMFADLLPVPAGRPTDSSVSHLKTSRTVGPHRRVGRGGALAARIESPMKNAEGQASIDHMAAARRLRWKLRNAQSHSPEEVKAGRLICRHLLAMLEEASPASQTPHTARPQNDNHYSTSLTAHR